MSGARRCHTFVRHAVDLMLCQGSVYGTRWVSRTLPPPGKFRGSGLNKSCHITFFAEKGNDHHEDGGVTEGAQNDSLFVYKDVDHKIDDSILEELELGKPSEWMIMKDVSSKLGRICVNKSSSG